ncbi:MAG: hypothetical protein M1833_004805 [Piccolia ochrophora]|nr:MAG: hypothetical protein M1833_004805 [Piccolia ochrophora]
MRFLSIISLALTLVTVHADLKCLKYALWNPYAGLWCHFHEPSFDEARDATVDGVETFAKSIYEADKFVVEHHPITLGVKYAVTTSTDGVPQANFQLQQEGKEVGNAAIGFAKESANIGDGLLRIYDLAHWNDVSFCVMQGAMDLRNQVQPIDPELTSRKRAAPPKVQEGLALAKECTAEKLERDFRPAIFNITDPDQKVGSTMADMASLLIPVGPEADAASGVSRKGYQLVMEGTGGEFRVFKDVDGVSADFASKQEALKAKEILKDPEQTRINCRENCSPPTVAKHRRWSNSRLNRRGINLGWCCKLPATLPDPPPEVRETPKAVYSSRMTAKTVTVSEAPKYTKWVNVAASKEAILKDLEELETAAVAWEPEVVGEMSSTELFAFLRKVFTRDAEAIEKDPAFAPLYDLLEIKTQDEASAISPGRLGTSSTYWLERASANNIHVQKMQAYTRAAIDQGKRVVGKLKGLSDAEIAALQGDIDFYYIPKSKFPLRNPDARDFHTDMSIMQFGAADQPGLVVKYGDKFSRVPLADDTFYLMKCLDWDPLRGTKGSTVHSVYGQEIADHGRVSMVMNIAKGMPY